MSLFGALHVGATAIGASNAALQVIGNNVANATTEGYAREDVVLSPIGSLNSGTLNIGVGVQVTAIAQQTDSYLTERAREASGEFAAADARSEILRRIEGYFNELGDEDLSTLLNGFYSSIQDVQNTPDDQSLRSLAVEQGALVAETIQSLRERVDTAVADINDEVRIAADEINDLLEGIAELNREIVAAEVGGNQSDAGSLRTLRQQKLESLTEMIDITVREDENGLVNVYSGSDYLLFEGSIQGVDTIQEGKNGLLVDTLVFGNSSNAIPTTGGRLGGLQTVRDEDLATIIEDLDTLASTLIYEFNKLHSSGQGLQNYTEVTGTYSVTDPTAALDSAAAGLTFTPTNGSFELLVINSPTDTTTTHVIEVDLDGIGADDSLDDIVTKINTAFGSAVASVTTRGELHIDAPDSMEFAFGEDTSGLLASLGVNTFFTGHDSSDIGVSSELRSNGQLFAAAQNGAAGDTSNAELMGQFGDLAFDAISGLTFSDYYVGLVEDVAVASASAQTQASILETTMTALKSESLSVSGVSLDEEAVKLISFQRSFQAATRFISVIDELLGEIIGLA